MSLYSVGDMKMFEHSMSVLRRLSDCGEAVDISEMLGQANPDQVIAIYMCHHLVTDRTITHHLVTDNIITHCVVTDSIITHQVVIPDSLFQNSLDQVTCEHW